MVIESLKFYMLIFYKFLNEIFVDLTIDNNTNYRLDI